MAKIVTNMRKPGHFRANPFYNSKSAFKIIMSRVSPCPQGIYNELPGAVKKSEGRFGYLIAVRQVRSVSGSPAEDRQSSVKERYRCNGKTSDHNRFSAGSCGSELQVGLSASFLRRSKNIGKTLPDVFNAFGISPYIHIFSGRKDSDIIKPVDMVGMRMSGQNRIQRSDSRTYCLYTEFWTCVDKDRFSAVPADQCARPCSGIPWIVRYTYWA